MKVLITCPPMLRGIEKFRPIFAEKNIEIVTPNVTQVMTEAELIELLPDFDAWIIGDDPANRKVFTAAKAGKLKAAVKWGVGVDNVDFQACKDLNIPISNTPKMFGNEVADVAVGYVLALARQLVEIDRNVRNGNWFKPAGQSLSNKHIALVGFGDIGQNVHKRLKAFDMSFSVYDPYASTNENINFQSWPNQLEKADYIVFTCALTKENKHMFNMDTLAKLKQGVRVVNVARGPLIDERALMKGLESKLIHSAALDVFEIEPMGTDHPILQYSNCIVGSHNGSHTVEGVERASLRAIELLFGFLGVK